jgi:hypothetical protein
MTSRVQEAPAPGESQLTAEFIEFLKRASAARPRGSGGEVLRFNQGRATGCVDAEFTVPEGLPDALRVGLFATPRTYKAVIRFANATSATDRERDTRGMAIGVLDAAPDNLTPGQTRQDFVLNSHPVMPARGPKEFLELLRANEAGGAKRALYFATHFRSTRVVLASRQHHACHLDIHYWSTTPYSFGAGPAVKYMARPALDHVSRLPDQVTDTYLRDALRAHLAQADASFDLMVQFYVDENRTPIEDAMVEWTQDRSPWQAVAHIRIPRQPVDDAARAARCEQTAFNPWHARPEHRPLGGMNRARKEIYRAMSEFRRAAGAQAQGVNREVK